MRRKRMPTSVPMLTCTPDATAEIHRLSGTRLKNTMRKMTISARMITRPIDSRPM